VGVAGLVQVDVDGELLGQPDVPGQPAAADLLDPVDPIELGARGVGVAGAARRRHGAVGGPGLSQEVDVARAVGGLRDRAAGVADLDEGAGERRGHGAARKVVEAGRIGRPGATLKSAKGKGRTGSPAVASAKTAPWTLAVAKSRRSSS